MTEKAKFMKPLDVEQALDLGWADVLKARKRLGELGREKIRGGYGYYPKSEAADREIDQILNR